MEKKYYEFINKPLIKELFKKREKYNEKIVKKNEDVKYVKQNKDIPDKLPSNFSEYLLGKKGKLILRVIIKDIIKEEHISTLRLKELYNILYLHQN